MILRKPYAFLIKYFKLIHITITLLSIYVVFKMNDILKYVNNYFKTNTGKSSALQYIDYTSIIIIILSLAIVGLIIWLMKYKNKPRLVYWLYIIVYLVTIAILLISFNELNAIFTANDTARGLRAVIDITRISIWCQYYLIAYMLIRGLGFDIKRFNFKRDLEELQIENNDNEEVEVTFGGNTETLKRKGRRSIRELKYYYIENKYIINILIILIIVGVVFFIITDRTITNVVYNKGDTAQSGIYNIKLINSYITNQSSSGKTILDNEYKLVVVKFAINNTSTNNTQINTDYLVLDVDGNQITATNKYNNYLSDLGTIYKKQYITNNIKYFILVYKVNQSDIKKNMKFLYLGNYNNGSNLTFNLNPVTLDNNKLKQSVNLNAELKFNDSLLNNTTLKITQYEIQNKYEYNYCYKEDCSYTATIDSLDNNIIKMDIESSIDESIDLEKNWNDIINNYMNIYYVIDDITYNSLICYSKTPSELDNVIYLEVDKNIEKASKIWLEFNIRNTIYKYTIKES